MAFDLSLVESMSISKSIKASPFQVVCRFYIISLCLIALTVPLFSDQSLRRHVAGRVGAVLTAGDNSQSLLRALDRNQVQLARELPRTKASPNLSFIVMGAAAKHRVDPALVKAVIHVESRTGRSRISPKGARGFMQLMPTTARLFGVSDIHDPVQNIYGGARYLRHLLDMFHNDTRLALAAYNAGPAKVRQYNGVPPYVETQEYVNKVMSAYRGYRQFYS